MADLSDFKRGQIVVPRMTGAIVTITAELFGVASCTVSKVMTAFEKEGKHLSQTLEESESYQIGTIEILPRIVKKDHNYKAPKIAAVSM